MKLSSVVLFLLPIKALGAESLHQERRALAQRFAPQLLLHPQERYFPMDPSRFFAQLQATKSDAFLESGQDALRSGEGVPVLVNISADQRSLQYWFFYPYNGCQQFRVQYQLYGPLRWGNRQRLRETFELCNIGIHEGDWEHVTVRLDEKREQVTSVFYSSHEAGIELPASSVLFDNERPLVHVALGSHANLPTPLDFQPFTTIRNGFYTWTFGIESLQFGDLVSGPTRSPAASSSVNNSLKWDTAQKVWLWEEVSQSDFAQYKGLWGLVRDARTLHDPPSMPGIVGSVLKTGTELFMKFKSDTQKLSQGRPPESPWVRRRWLNHDLEPGSDSYNLPHGPMHGGLEGLDFDDSPSLKAASAYQLLELSLVENEGRLGICTKVDQMPRLCHGVSQGNKRSLRLKPGEYVKGLDLSLSFMEASSFQKADHFIRALRLRTNLGQSIEIGQWTNIFHSVEAPAGLQVGGWFGNEDQGLRALGPVFIQQPTP